MRNRRRLLPHVAALAALGLVAVLAPAAVGAQPGDDAAAADDPPRYRPYYGVFDRGEAKIPYLDDTPYVPQGLAHLPELDAMVVSYYDDGGGKARLALLDRATSAHLKTVELDDTGHVGGLATSDGFLWVASTGAEPRLLRYPTSALVEAADGATVTRDADWAVPASSFVEVRGDQLYVGLFERGAPGALHRYTLDADQVPQDDGVTIPIPSNVQGMAFVGDDTVVWSRSFSRVDDSELAIGPLEGEPTTRLVAPNMSEDLAVADGELFVVYESAAAKFPDADYKVRTIHHAAVADLVG